jgi:hypothetical protein
VKVQLFSHLVTIVARWAGLFFFSMEMEDGLLKGAFRSFKCFEFQCKVSGIGRGKKQLYELLK